MIYTIVQLPSHVWLSATPWTPACQASLSFTISLNVFKLMSIESVMPASHLILCCSFLLCSNSCPSSWWCHLILHCPFLFLPSIFPRIRVFSNESVFFFFFASGGQSIGVSVSALVLPINIQNWFSLGLTGFILQSKGLSRVFSNKQHSSKASILWHSAFFEALTSIHDYRFGLYLPQTCFPGGLESKESTCSEGDTGLGPGSGRSPRVLHGNALQYSWLENPARRAWMATVHGVSKSPTWLSN